MAQCIHWILYFLWKKKSSTTYELWTLSRRGTFDLRCHRNVNFDIFSHIYIWPVTQCLKTAKKVSFLRAKRATLISKKNLLSLHVALLLKPLVIRFCPLKIRSDSFRLFYTVNTQNLEESERIYKGQKRFTKGFLWK